MTATWRQVARKDLEDAARSRLVWGIVVVYVGFLAMALASAEQLFPPEVAVTPRRALAGVAQLSQLFLPGVALVVGYAAVVGERRDGSLRVLLSYPFSRRDVVLGKLLGRSAVTVLGLAVSYAVASVLVVGLYGAPDAWTFAGFVGAGVLLGLAFTGLAVGGSAASATRTRAMALTAGAFVAMVFFWKPAVVGLYYLKNGSVPGLVAERWYFLVKRLNPLEAFRVVSTAALDQRVAAFPRLPLEDVPMRAAAETLAIGNRVAGEVPLSLEPWFAAVVLVAWGTVPLLVGLRRFERADLG
ncbi:MAG: ABC transporter permease subunit [Halobacteriaceae archaeon]